MRLTSRGLGVALTLFVAGIGILTLSPVGYAENETDGIGAEPWMDAPADDLAASAEPPQPAIELDRARDHRLPSPVSGGSVEGACGDRELHTPIRVVGNRGPQGFVLDDPRTGEPLHRPGSGVVQGSGTADDPYVIRGWCIVPPHTTPYDDLLGGIVLEDTDAHVVIEDNVVVHPGLVYLSTGISVSDSANVEVRENKVFRMQRGYHVEGSRSIDLVNNTEVGSRSSFWLEGSENLTLRDNTARWPYFGGVYAKDVIDLEVRGNTVKHVAQADGFYLWNTPKVSVGDNTVADVPRDGILLRGSPNAEVVANTVREAGNFGLYLYESPGPLVDENTVDGTGSTAIRADLSDGTVFTDNEVHEAGTHGIVRAGGDGGTVARNTVENSDGNAVFLYKSRWGGIKANDLRANDGAGVVIIYGGPQDVAGNRLSGNGKGAVALSQSGGVDVYNNTVTGNWGGIGYLGWANGHESWNNTVTGNEIGLGIVGAWGYVVYQTSFTRNQVQDNQVGVLVDGVNWQNELHRNNIKNNTVGLDAEESYTSVNATRNWWGCPDGPSHEDCNDAKGKVTVDPWLTEPVAEAGAS